MSPIGDPYRRMELLRHQIYTRPYALCDPVRTKVYSGSWPGVSRCSMWASVKETVGMSLSLHPYVGYGGVGIDPVEPARQQRCLDPAVAVVHDSSSSVDTARVALTSPGLKADLSFGHGVFQAIQPWRHSQVTSSAVPLDLGHPHAGHQVQVKVPPLRVTTKTAASPSSTTPAWAEKDRLVVVMLPVVVDQCGRRRCRGLLPDSRRPPRR